MISSPVFSEGGELARDWTRREVAALAEWKNNPLSPAHHCVTDDRRCLMMKRNGLPLRTAAPMPSLTAIPELNFHSTSL
jgi:hypothetical protein